MVDKGKDENSLLFSFFIQNFFITLHQQLNLFKLFTMEWIDITIEKPSVARKYLVKTKTSMGNIHRLDASYSITKDKKTGKEKSSFNVSNQVVTHWLKE